MPGISSKTDTNPRSAADRRTDDDQDPAAASALSPSSAPSPPSAPLARLDELADGSLTRRVHRGVPLLLCRVGASVHVVDDACTHEEVSLSLGSLSGHCLRCPLHGAAFDVRDGSVLEEPAERALRTWPTRVVDGWVVIDG